MSDVREHFLGVRVLVTGGGGYVGRRLVKALHDLGAKVTALDLHSSAVEGAAVAVSCDISDPKSLKETLKSAGDLSYRFVFHLAAQKNIPESVKHPDATFRVNVGGTAQIFAACKGFEGLRGVVFASTYGVSLPEAPAESPYMVSKRIGEMLAKSYFSHAGLPAAICRLANVYGPGQSDDGVIPSMLKQMLAKASPLQLGNTSAKRDFIYVDDVVSGLIAAAVTPAAAGQILDIGTGRSTSVADVATIVGRLLHFHGTIHSEQSRMRAQDISELIADSANMRQLCGWSAVIGLEEGLSRVIEAAAIRSKDFGK